MKDGRVRLGVVGAGIWGRMHARAYMQHPSAELVGICDLDGDKAEALAEEFGIANWTLSLDDLLSHDLDGVSIATPDGSHAAVAIRAAQSGAHLLVEKPLAKTVEECEEMIAVAEENNVFLMMDWHNRWNPPYVHARQAIQGGELGNMQYIYYRLSDTIFVPTKMLPWAGASSVMLFLGSHALDTACWLMGQKPVRVTCRRKEGLLTGMGIDTADMYVTLVDFEDGAMATIENSWVLPQCSPSLIDHRCEVVGTEGAISMNF